MTAMEQRDLGVQPDYVERAFKRLEVLSVSASQQAREYFGGRAEQLADLAFIQANRPLKRPGKEGWRFAPSPMSVQAIADKKLAFVNRVRAA